MSLCKCEFPGDLSSMDHRRFHRAWEKGEGRGPTYTEATVVEVTDMYETLDRLIAHAHGGPLPELTPGAQAILTREAMNR